MTRGAYDYPVYHDNFQQFQQAAAVGGFVQGNSGYSSSSVASYTRPPGFTQPNIQASRPNQGYMGNKGYNRTRKHEVTKTNVQPESSQSTANVQPRVDHGKGKDKLKDDEFSGFWRIHGSKLWKNKAMPTISIDGLQSSLHKERISQSKRAKTTKNDKKCKAYNKVLISAAKVFINTASYNSVSAARRGYSTATAVSPAVESFVNFSDKSGSDKGYHLVPPPLIGNFIPHKLDLTFIDEIVESENMDVTTVVTPSNVKTVENKGVSNTVKYYTVRRECCAPINEELVSDGKKKTVFPTISKIEFVGPKQPEKPVRKPVKYAKMYSFDHLKKDCSERMVKPVWNNARRENHQNSTRMTHTNSKRNMVPQAVLMRSRLKTINTARSRAVVNAANPKAGSHKHEPELDFDAANVPITTAGVEISTARPEVKTAGDSIEDIAVETLVYIRRSASKEKDKAVRLQAKVDKEERQRISKAEGLFQELLQKIFIQAERSRR
ncbi:hypothetical protein Tco_1209462 [Tanacetum coccineum]